MNIKPCPFCNKEAKLIPCTKFKSNESYFMIGCETEDCYMQDGSGWEFHENDIEFHIKLWNKRYDKRYEELPKKITRTIKQSKIFYSMNELAEILGINPHSVYGVIERKAFPFKPVKLGSGRIKFFRSEVDEYIESLKRKNY